MITKRQCESVREPGGLSCRDPESGAGTRGLCTATLWCVCESLFFSFHAAGCRLQRDRDGGHAKPGLLGSVLMRQLCGDEKNTHRAAQETSAGLPKVILLKWKADRMLVIVASRGQGWIVTGLFFNTPPHALIMGQRWVEVGYLVQTLPADALSYPIILD